MGARIHRLKTWCEPFQAVKHGLKPFEIRKNDRDYRKGDYLVLDEWNHVTGSYTTDEPIVRVVTYLLPGGRFGLAEDHVAMGVDKLSHRQLELILLDVAPERGASPSSGPGEKEGGSQ